jgi:hypothetical protein
VIAEVQLDVILYPVTANPRQWYRQGDPNNDRHNGRFEQLSRYHITVTVALAAIAKGTCFLFSHRDRKPKKRAASAFSFSPVSTMSAVRARLFHVAAVLSLGICISSAVMWARSYNVSYRLARQQYDPATRIYEAVGFGLSSGRLTWAHDSGPIPIGVDVVMPLREGWQEWRNTYWFADRAKYPFNWFFFNWEQTPGSYRLGLNLLFVTALSAILPARWRYVDLRTRRRVAQKACATCGYDLRASSDRCPECGTELAKS